MSILPPSNTATRASTTGWAHVKAEAERRAAEQAARDADPVERAIRYIRSRGRVIFRASVDGGPADRWKHNGKLLDAEGVIALADSIQRLSAQIRAVPPAPPVSVSPQPICRLAVKPEAVAAPQPTPAASATAIQEAPMAHHLKTETSEQANCRERGTTPSRVKSDLKALRDKLGNRRLTDMLNLGNSTIGNVINGHSGIGPTILTALYGETGCALRPDLASVLEKAKTETEEVGPAPIDNAGTVPLAGQASHDAADLERKADVARMWGQPVEGEPASPETELPATGQGLGPFTGGPLAFGETSTTTFPVLDLVPDMAQLNVADLLAGARRRRDQLQAELADIDVQIRAVLKLAAVAA